MNLFSYLKGDKVIWTIVLLLSIISVLVVYSSIVTLAYKYKSGDTSYYLIKHSLIIGMGIFLMYLTHTIKYTYYSRLSQLALFVAAPLLLFTLLKGANLNEASRWLEVPGTGLTFQTSDFAKLALIAYVARMLALKQNEIKDFKKTFLPIVIPIVAICGLILPANFSTSAVLFTTCMVLLFIGRVSFKHLGILLLSAVMAFSIFILIIFAFPNINNRVATWKARIENFSKNDSEGNYQVEQAKIAIATGGVVGKGPGKSTQRNFLPHPYSDFIFAIIIEEYGLGLALVIVLLYLILLYRAINIAGKCQKTFGSLLAIGCCFLLVFQAMINMAVAVNLFPVTGQPLPLVSMGGTSIWFTSIAFGIILSISRDLDPEPPKTETLETA
ncbi:MAG: FtsW/RodA/SpoVE family cell cycle protein [Bacteroidetes bacterium]|nr:FtsW/RodA/SpoVE family cell cycle protein [Bacteroidota bacterium]